MKTITKNEFYDATIDMKPVTEKIIEDKRRWVSSYSQVFKDLKTGKYYDYFWEEPNTEYQEGSESDEVIVYEVKPVEKIVIQYVLVKEE